VRTVVQFKILSGIIVIILCAVLVFQPTVAVSLHGYPIYIQQPIGTAAATATSAKTAMKLSNVVKILIDNAIQEFQSNNINNTMMYLTGAEQELLSSLPNIKNNNNIMHTRPNLVYLRTVIFPYFLKLV
jgi:hypothetical protein